MISWMLWISCSCCPVSGSAGEPRGSASHAQSQSKTPPPCPTTRAVAGTSLDGFSHLVRTAGLRRGSRSALFAALVVADAHRLRRVCSASRMVPRLPERRPEPLVSNLCDGAAADAFSQRWTRLPPFPGRAGPRRRQGQSRMTRRDTRGCCPPF